MLRVIEATYRKRPVLVQSGESIECVSSWFWVIANLLKGGFFTRIDRKYTFMAKVSPDRIKKKKYGFAETEGHPSQNSLLKLSISL